MFEEYSLADVREYSACIHLWSSAFTNSVDRRGLFRQPSQVAGAEVWDYLRHTTFYLSTSVQFAFCRDVAFATFSEFLLCCLSTELEPSEFS